jgi:hypothetical protein
MKLTNIKLFIKIYLNNSITEAIVSTQKYSKINNREQ